MKKTYLLSVVALVSVMALGSVSFAEARTTKAELYYNGQIVRTVANPANLPHGGTDPIFNVTNGVQGQLGIAEVAPGDPGYHGGRWAVYLVTFNAGVTPYLLTSDEAVDLAETAGDVTVTRAPQLDNRCPIQP